jgi:hypothetical protein
MKKLILMSIMMATIAIPIRLAGVPDARAALRRTIVYAVIFNVIYCLLLLFVYGRFT